MNSYLVLKALHLISVVSWFAGLFYLVRLFIYDVEARALGGEEGRILSRQFGLMQSRLWFGITVPASILTALFGFWMMFEAELWRQSWFQLKLVLLVGLYLYHGSCAVLRKRLERGETSLPSSRVLRIWNEVATIFLVSIVPLAVLKALNAPLPFVVGFILFGVLVFGILGFIRRRGVKASSSAQLS
jgi:putative membrane protein